MALFVALALPAAALPAVAEEPVAASSGSRPGSEPEFRAAARSPCPRRKRLEPGVVALGRLCAARTLARDNKEMLVRANGGHRSAIRQQSAVAPGQSRFFFPEVVERRAITPASAGPEKTEGKAVRVQRTAARATTNLYLASPTAALRVLRSREKDGHAHWSPVRDQIAFISGRTEKATCICSISPQGHHPADARRVALSLSAVVAGRQAPRGHPGINENHDIYILEPGAFRPCPLKALQHLAYDDLRPVWSPDGKRLAFYTNYNPPTTPRLGDRGRLPRRFGPEPGRGLAARVVGDRT